MKTTLLFLALFGVSTSTLAISPNDISPPEAFGNTFISDAADILNAKKERELDNDLVAYYEATGNQIAVITTPDTKGSASPRNFANELFERFEFGEAGVDNGLLILLSVGDKRIEFETGYGIEGLLPDVTQHRIQQEYMIPFFKEGDYQQGLIKGTYAVIDKLSASSESQAEYLAAKAITADNILQVSGFSDDLPVEKEDSLLPPTIFFSVLFMVFIIFMILATFTALFVSVFRGKKSDGHSIPVDTKGKSSLPACRLCNKAIPKDTPLLPLSGDTASNFDLKVMALGVARVKSLNCPSCGYSNKQVSFTKRMTACSVCSHQSNYALIAGEFRAFGYINTYIDKIDRTSPLSDRKFKSVKKNWQDSQVVDFSINHCYMCENFSNDIYVYIPKLPQKPPKYTPKPSSNPVKYTSTSTSGSRSTSRSSSSKRSSVGSSWGSSSKSRSSTRSKSKPRSRGGRSGGGGAGSGW